MTGSRIVSIGVGYLLNVYLARRLGPAGFGLFAVVITILVWLELVVAEGLPLWVVRSAGDAREGGRLPRSYVLVQLGVSLALAALLVAVAPALARVFAQPADAALRYATSLFRVSAVDIPLFGLYNLFLAVLLGAGAYGLQATSTSGYAIVKLVATVALVQAGLSVLGGVLGTIVGSLGGLLLVLALIALRLRGVRLFGQETHRRREAVAGSVVPAALLIVQTLALSADVWIVKATLPPADAGFYRAASLIAQVPIALSGGLVWALYSAYSDAHRRGDTERLRHYASQTVRLLVAGGALAVALVAPTARALLVTVYSARYAAGGPLLATLVAGTGVGVVALALAPTLIIEGRGRPLLAGASVLVGVEVAAAVVLAPRVGPLGAAAPVAAAFALAAVLILGAVRRRLAFPLASTLVRLLVPAALVAAAALALRPAPGLGLLAWYAALTAGYAVLLVASRGLTAADLAAVREGLR